MILDSRTIFPQSCQNATPLIFAVEHAPLFENLVDSDPNPCSWLHFIIIHNEDWALASGSGLLWSLVSSHRLRSESWLHIWNQQVMAEVRQGSSLCVHWPLPLFPLAVAKKWRRRKCWAGIGTSSHIIYLFTIFNILFHSISEATSFMSNFICTE